MSPQVLVTPVALNRARTGFPMSCCTEQIISTCRNSPFQLSNVMSKLLTRKQLCFKRIFRRLLVLLLDKCKAAQPWCQVEAADRLLWHCVRTGSIPCLREMWGTTWHSLKHMLGMQCSPRLNVLWVNWLPCNRLLSGQDQCKSQQT